MDALACPCGGRLKFEELVVEREEVREQLQQRGLSPDGPKPRKGPIFDERDDYTEVPQEVISDDW